MANTIHLERANTVNSILTESDKVTALGIFHALREVNMMGDAIAVVARRFNLQFEAVADWYYLRHYPQY